MTRARPIIAIDGPVGAGKSTVARELARALAFSYINTGAMYRAVALVARESGISPGDAQIERRLAGILDMIAITFDGERVHLSSRDITAAIAAPEVGDLASRLSTLASVRRKMRGVQVLPRCRRRGASRTPMARTGCEGRKRDARRGAGAVARARPARQRARTCAA